MIKNVFIVGVLVLITVIVGLFVILILSITAQYGEFEYATNSGETGTASFCAVSYGQARCQTDDGATIMVERYTKR
jgi:hypothetical protein